MKKAKLYRKLFRLIKSRESGTGPSLASDRKEMKSAMLQIFTKRQRSLFFKKLKGRAMDKTEREYFSRVVRKKAAALANASLHHLARKLLGT